MTRVLVFSLLAFWLRYAAADSEISLFVPFVAPQALSADLLGIDTALGRTTWVLRQGAHTGTWTDAQESFPGTATLVEGTDYASFTYAFSADALTLGGECSLGAGSAVCVALGDRTTTTVTDSATVFGVEVASAAPTANSKSDTPTSTVTGTPGPASGAGSGAPSSTQSGSSVRVLASSALGALVSLLVAYYLA
ncbi:hypothetical protein FB451DRAFT_1404831 [Mycena latifolia]|nr:hypothetical protein FB451DRAFT_1404831 [Mycena latifolia]